MSRKINNTNEPSLNEKSSSDEEESDEEEEEVPDYLDKAGRKWHFLCHAKEEEDLAQFVQQNGLVPGNENGKRRKFGCSRPECQFRAVFLKANSGIYTRGEHWHEHLDGQKTRKVMKRRKKEERIIFSLSFLSKIVIRAKEEFLIIQGRQFRLVRRFETDEEFEKYRRENWLIKNSTRKSYKDRIILCCRRSTNKQKVSTNCRVSGVYVKHNRSLYQNSQQHNHPMGKEYENCFSRFLSKYADDKKAEYVDHLGQHWHFHSRINNLKEFEKFAKKQLLYLNNTDNAKLFYFECKYAHPAILKKYPYPPPYCKLRAIFIKATSSFYIRNAVEHSDHPPFQTRTLTWSRHHKLYRKLSAFFKANNAKKNGRNHMRNAEQNVPIPKEEADSAGEEEGEEEVRIVKHLQRDYKCLGRMKREGGAMTSTDMQLDEEGMDMEEEGSSQGRGRGTFYRYTQRELQRPIKKEEPAEEPEEAEEEALHLQVPQPQMPPEIQIQMPQWLLQPQQVAQPAKMLLRERKKRINYGK